MNNEQKTQEIHYLYKDDSLAIAIPSTKQALSYLIGIHHEIPEEMNFVQTSLANLFNEMDRENPLVLYISRDEVDGVNVFAGHKSELWLLDVLNDDPQAFELPLSVQESLLKVGNPILDFCMQHGNLKPLNFEKGTFSEETLLKKIKEGVIGDADIHPEERTTAMQLETVAYNMNHGKTAENYFDDFPSGKISLSLSNDIRKSKDPGSTPPKKPQM